METLQFLGLTKKNITAHLCETQSLLAWCIGFSVSFVPLLVASILCDCANLIASIVLGVVVISLSVNNEGFTLTDDATKLNEIKEHFLKHMRSGVVHFQGSNMTSILRKDND